MGGSTVITHRKTTVRENQENSEQKHITSIYMTVKIGTNRAVGCAESPTYMPNHRPCRAKHSHFLLGRAALSSIGGKGDPRLSRSI